MSSVNHNLCLRFLDPRGALVLNSAICWNITSCNWFQSNRRFGRTCSPIFRVQEYAEHDIKADNPEFCTFRRASPQFSKYRNRPSNILTLVMKIIVLLAIITRTPLDIDRQFGGTSPPIIMFEEYAKEDSSVKSGVSFW